MKREFHSTSFPGSDLDFQGHKLLLKILFSSQKQRSPKSRTETFHSLTNTRHDYTLHLVIQNVVLNSSGECFPEDHLHTVNTGGWSKPRAPMCHNKQNQTKKKYFPHAYIEILGIAMLFQLFLIFPFFP